MRVIRETERQEDARIAELLYKRGNKSVINTHSSAYQHCRYPSHFITSLTMAAMSRRDNTMTVNTSML